MANLVRSTVNRCFGFTEPLWLKTKEVLEFSSQSDFFRFQIKVYFLVDIKLKLSHGKEAG